MITSYCVGFLFTSDEDQVLLIRKRLPSWQAGRLNGIGGKIEAGETPLDALAREFKEEAGVGGLTWENCAVHTGAGFCLHVFAAFNDFAFGAARAMTDEPIERIAFADIYLPRSDLISNLRVHVAIALDRSGLAKPVRLFEFSCPEAQ
jgi:8-oxo-dGTP diphosphatase